MRSLTLPLIAAAALSLGSSPAAASVGSWPHGPGSVAHHRRFDRVMRTPVEKPDAQPVIDLELRDGAFVPADSTLDGEPVDGGNKTLVKRGGYSGRATFFTPGLGACGTHSSSSDFVRPLVLTCWTNPQVGDAPKRRSSWRTGGLWIALEECGTLTILCTDGGAQRGAIRRPGRRLKVVLPDDHHFVRCVRVVASIGLSAIVDMSSRSSCYFAGGKSAQVRRSRENPLARPLR